MKVILTDNIERLGKIGDVVTVKEGYARNFLFPHNKAKVATPGNIKSLDASKKKMAAEEAKKLEGIKAIADKLAKLSLTISAPVGEEEKLYGSVTNDHIAKALEAEGFAIDKKDISMDEPIKKLGVYQVNVKLHPEVKTVLRVWIVKQ